MIKNIFEDNSLSCSKTFNWFKRFKGVQCLNEDDPRSGRPSMLKKIISIALTFDHTCRDFFSRGENVVLH